MTPRRVSPREDVEVTALLRPYRIPRRHQPGTITDRFPHPYRPTAAFPHAVPTRIRLPGSHIEQFTGYPPIRSSTPAATTASPPGRRPPSRPGTRRTYPPQSP